MNLTYWPPERVHDFLICVGLVLAMGAVLFAAGHIARFLSWLEKR